MTDDKRPREFELFYSGLSGQLMARNYQKYELGPDDLYLITVELSAYDSLAQKLKEAEAEVERLKDTPGGKRLYLTFNELTRERELTAMLREACEMPTETTRQLASREIAIRKALTREKEMRK